MRRVCTKFRLIQGAVVNCKLGKVGQSGEVRIGIVRLRSSCVGEGGEGVLVAAYCVVMADGAIYRGKPRMMM